ncbi:unnamed protein product [Rotaria sordida]|uniref:Transmembrane protein 231 n=1 Tax=Rotaria sordida TaxID=392033 RepID=A0A818T3G1_9BILA|nr:unnamed protein product [Rotaria sordida]CAF3679440.1 unnamed protein product [Rotaria sordida]CAF3800717.1 unnamed protein product [Rotaria sordida]
MPLYEVFSHSDRYHYRANLFSLATCFLILCTILTFLPPFLFAYYANGFWIKEGRYSEQARINYSSKYILFVDNNDITTNRFFISSYSSINAIFRNVMIFGTNTFSAIDNNNDNIVDQFSITFQVLVGNNNTNVIINNINVWLIFQYELRARQYINMETMALINLFPPNGITLSNNPNVTIVGDLILEQRQPIQSSGIDTIYNKSIINLDNLFTTSSINLNPILDEYFTRKYYTSYQTQYIKWKSGTITGTNILTINIIVNIGRQSIRFIPGFWQEFKWGWIQYICVLLPFIFVFNRIKEFVFHNQLVKTLIELPYHRYKA